MSTVDPSVGPAVLAPVGKSHFGISRFPLSRFAPPTNLRIPIYRFLIWRHLSSTNIRGPCCHVSFGISRIANPRYKFSWVSKTLNAEPRYSDGTCAFLLPRHLPSPLYRKSRNRDFTCRYSLHREIPNAESRYSEILYHVSP
jgi:hypothetical protein